jgi:Glycosyl transferase 4-like domain
MRIAIFDPLGSYVEIPTLQCVLEKLEATKALIHVYLRTGGEPLKQFCLARACPFPVTPSLWAGDLAHTLRGWRWFFRSRAWVGLRRLASTRYDLAMAVNPEGVIAAHRYWKRTRTPYIYFSFEQIFRQEMRGAGLTRVKAAEIAASRQARIVVTQDPWRARLLAEENGLPLEKLHLMPVAPRGGELPPRTDYLRDRLRIGHDQRIVLHSGSWTGFTCAGELTKSATEWPSRLVLVVNLRERPDQLFVRRLERLRLDNVRICKRPLAADEYHELIRSADLGLAFYQPTGRNPFEGRNIEVMGLSSGKTACYARYGLPMIFGGQPEMRSFLARYQFGEYTDDPRMIPVLAANIFTNWNHYSRGAQRFFREQLDFDAHWPELWERISHGVLTRLK